MASTLWMRFRIAVRWPTSALRRPVSSRSCRVASSGCQTSGRKSQRRSWASTWASTLSVLTLAWAMALVAMGLETTHPGHVRPQDVGHGPAVGGGLQGHVVGGPQDLRGEQFQGAAVQGEPLAVDDFAGVVDDAGLDHALVDIEADVTYHCNSSWEFLL